MRIISPLLLTLVTVTSAFASGSTPPRGSLRSYPGSGQENPTIESARSFAIDLLDRALNNEDQTAHHNMKLRLARVPVLYAPTGYDFASCTSDSEGEVQAYVMSFMGFAENRVYACATVLDNGIPELAQVLIHEAIHTLGDTDECSTTRKEMSVYASAKTPMAMYSVYYVNCPVEVPEEIRVPGLRYPVSTNGFNNLGLLLKGTGTSATPGVWRDGHVDSQSEADALVERK